MFVIKGEHFFVHFGNRAGNGVISFKWGRHLLSNVARLPQL